MIEIISACGTFSGGKRHYELVKEYLPLDHEWIFIKGAMDSLLSTYKLIKQPLVVFASGDPFFYGIGNTIQRLWPEADIESYPAFNSIQRLCAKTKTNYNELKSVSVHGRDWSALDEAIIKEEPLIGVLTDNVKDPKAIAKRLLDYGNDYSMTVGEELDGANERIRSFELFHGDTNQGEGHVELFREDTNQGEFLSFVSSRNLTEHTFSSLNCLLLHRRTPRRNQLGIPDAQFIPLPNRPNMITKMPVRICTIQALQLIDKKVFWDIGTCTGSVAIEAKKYAPHLEVVAFEKRPECENIIKENCQQFTAPGIEVVMGDFFEQDLDTLKTPDVVFVGGHGNRLEELLNRLEQLAPQARIVTNAVLETSSQTFKQVLKNKGYEIESTQLKVDEHNPIQLISAFRIK